jgi:hypothetical protein
MERINSPEPIGIGRIKILDNTYQGKPSPEYSQNAFSAGGNNDGRITEGLGSVIGTFAQHVQQSNFENQQRFMAQQQQLATVEQQTSSIGDNTSTSRCSDSTNHSSNSGYGHGK